MPHPQAQAGEYPESWSHMSSAEHTACLDILKEDNQGGLLTEEAAKKFYDDVAEEIRAAQMEATKKVRKTQPGTHVWVETLVMPQMNDNGQSAERSPRSPGSVLNVQGCTVLTCFVIVF